MKKIILLFLLPLIANATDWYTPTGNPTPGSVISSAIIRSEYSLIGSSFTKLPALTGNASKVVGVNASGTGLEAFSNASVLTNIGAQPSSAALTSLSANPNSYMTSTLGISSFITPLLSTTTNTGAQTALGFGTSALQNTGTSANNVVQLDSGAAIPAVDGSKISNLEGSTPYLTITAASGIITATLNAPAKINVSYNGTTNQTTVTTNKTIAVPALASLGATTAVPTRLLLVYSYINGSLAVINSAAGTILNETTAYTPTVISTTSLSSTVMYSASGTTSSPYKILGYADATWTSGSGWTVSGSGSSLGSNSNAMMANNLNIVTTSSLSSLGAFTTKIPNGVKRITILIDDMSIGTAGIPYIALNAGGIPTTSYGGTVWATGSSNIVTVSPNSVNGLDLWDTNLDIAKFYYGVYTLTKSVTVSGSEGWIFNGNLSDYNGSKTGGANGIAIINSGVLTDLKLAVPSGIFDSSVPVTIIYE